MMTLAEELTQEAYDNGITVEADSEMPIPAIYLRTNKRTLILFQPTDTQAQLACILAEELGHHCTGQGRVLTYHTPEDFKAELRARRWGFDRIITPDRIIAALGSGLREPWEVAEYIGVTEEYLRDAIEDYRVRGKIQ